MREFVVHDQRDNVGVAVVDIRSGQVAHGAALDGAAVADVKAADDIPLGHKIALQEFKAGDTVVKYGEDIGKVIAPIRRGQHVHVHNLKTKRW